jgi:hypothetical protein
MRTSLGLRIPGNVFLLDLVQLHWSGAPEQGITPSKSRGTILTGKMATTIYLVWQSKFDSSYR